MKDRNPALSNSALHALHVLHGKEVFVLLLFLLVFLVHGAWAHESRPAYLEINETALGRYDVLWRTPLNAGMRLPVVLKFPDDVRNVTEPTVRELPDSLVERRLVDAGAGGLAGKRIDFVGLQGTIADVLVRVQMRNGTASTTLVRPSQAWVDIAASRGPLAVVGAYILHGIQHISFGVDHLLFVLGLLLIVKDRWMLLKTVTAFTVAHSITLAIATFGYADAPVIPLNAAIALSILFLGPEIVKQRDAGYGMRDSGYEGRDTGYEIPYPESRITDPVSRISHFESRITNPISLTIRYPWVVAFAFGLLHGFGFAGALTSAGLPRQDLPLALLSFNVGVEIGQVAFVLLVILLERSFRQLEIRWAGWAQALPGYVVGSLGAFWTIQRVAIMLGGR